MGDTKSHVIERPNYSNKTIILIILGIFLVGANLRAPLTSVGTLIGFIRDDLGMTNTSVGAITTLPLIAFALISPLAPKIAQRIGIEQTLLWSLVILLIGIVMRPFFGTSFLFIGTVLIGIGIAFGNVLMPSYIKLSFPLRVGVVMGIYTLSMNALSAIFSAISVPVANVNPYGWQGALAISGVLTIITIFIWLPRLKQPVPRVKHMTTGKKSNGYMWKSMLAWQVTMFMGLQSFIFYTIITWLPEMMITYGYTAKQGGWVLSIMQLLIIPMNFVIPIVAAKVRSQKLLSLFASLFLLGGVSGLLLDNATLVPIFAVMIGIGTGSAFSLSMMYFTLRTSDGYEAAELSGMAQFVGYLLSATGPILFGFLFDLTGGWTFPVLLLVICAAIVVYSGVVAGRDEVISK